MFWRRSFFDKLKVRILMKNVLLVGIGGVYNYGCEAIIRGSVNILHTIDPNMKISYASYNYEDDIKRLTDCNVTIINRPKRNRWSIHNIARKLLSFLHYEYVVPYDSTEWVKKYDTLFSIGGDMYTLNPDGSFYKSLPLFCEKCTSLGLKYVLWGASVGKFEKNPVALAFYKKHLLKADLLVLREKISFDYIQSFSVQCPMILAPDPAYFVAPEIRKEEKTVKRVIGVNLSPLSALYEYKDIKIAIERQTQAIIRLIDTMDIDIVLLPHVISSNCNDNDLYYMRNIYESLPQNYKLKVSLVDTDPSFVGLKKQIMKCDYVIAARMHCAVNALSVGVPSVFLAYSEKAKGMSEYIYNSQKPVIALAQFEDTVYLSNLLERWNYPSKIEEIRKFDFKVILDKLCNAKK